MKNEINQSALSLRISCLALLTAFMVRNSSCLEAAESDLDVVRTQAWAKCPCLVRFSGAKTFVECEGWKAEYAIKNGSEITTRNVVGFRIPKSGRLWVGPECDIYIETMEKVIGLQQELGGILLWRDTVVEADSAETLKSTPKADLISWIEQALSSAKLLERLRVDRPEKWTHLEPVFSTWFFDSEPYSSFHALAKISRLEVEGSILKLELTSPNQDYKGTVWLDIRTQKVTRAMEDGLEMYPNTAASKQRHYWKDERPAR